MDCEQCGFMLSANGFVSLRYITKEDGIYYVVCPECGRKNYWESLQNLGGNVTKKAAEG